MKRVKVSHHYSKLLYKRVCLLLKTADFQIFKSAVSGQRACYRPRKIFEREEAPD